MDATQRPTPVQALAAAAAVLVVDHDTVGTLTRLCIDCASSLGGRAAGLMIQHGDGGPLEFMTSSSHDGAELDLYELQAGEGPCLEAFEHGRDVSAQSPDEMRRRWPVFGTALADIGLASVQACPLQFRGQVLGALNVFWSESARADDQTRQVVQAFADMATVAVVQSASPASVDVPEVGLLALQKRTVIEQAKGVLAAVRGLDMAAAFEALRERALVDDVPLEAAAEAVIDEALRAHS